VSKQLSGDIGRADSLAREIFSDIANKWALLIIETIGDSTRRFTELKVEVDGISHKMLTQNLRLLERNGLVVRDVHPTVPPRVEYTLTEPGRELRKTVDAIAAILNHPRAEKRNLAVEGHADAIGQLDANRALALARAETVANELIVNNLRRERVTTHGYGEERPVAPNTNPDGTDNPEGRARNRRVEIVIDKE